MGDPRKQRKKFERPPHPWQGVRIEAEKILVQKYGLARKKEIWKMESLLRQFKRQAKNLTTRTDVQSTKEQKLLLKKMYDLGLLSQDAKLENILDLKVTDILDRRLQTIVSTKGLAHTPKQARQFIVHRHIIVSGKKVTVPSYMVKRLEEDKLAFDGRSPFNDKEHPERINKKEVPKQEVKAKEEKAEKPVAAEVAA